MNDFQSIYFCFCFFFCLIQQQNTDGNDADEGAEEMGEATSPKKPKKSSTLESLLGAVSLPTVKENGQKTPAMRAEDEIKRYRAEKPAGLNENPLTWWRSNEREYPLLARLAKQYLCVPGTSIASERVFSTAGDIVTAKRSCLTPDHVNELLFLNKNLRITKWEQSHNNWTWLNRQFKFTFSYVTIVIIFAL